MEIKCTPSLGPGLAHMAHLARRAHVLRCAVRRMLTVPACLSRNMLIVYLLPYTQGLRGPGGSAAPIRVTDDTETFGRSSKAFESSRSPFQTTTLLQKRSLPGPAVRHHHVDISLEHGMTLWWVSKMLVCSRCSPGKQQPNMHLKSGQYNKVHHSGIGQAMVYTATSREASPCNNTCVMP